MEIEGKDRGLRNIQLTSTQNRVAHLVTDALQQAQGRTLIVLEGLSGVGKSSVLRKIEGGVTKGNGRVVDPDDIKYDSEGRKIGGYRGHLVTTSTVGDIDIRGDIREIAAKRFRNIVIETVILPGMDEREISEYISHLQRRSKLSPAQMAQYSMGIPLIAEQLSLAGIDEKMAAKIAARYLIEGLRRIDPSELQAKASRYLQMLIPLCTTTEAVEMASSWNSKHIYDNLYLILQRQKEQRAKGAVEESPLFIAPESEHIYDAMLQSDGKAGISIFVPAMKREDFIRVQQSFGFKWGRYSDSEASRVRMFGGSYRKVSFWHKDTNGEEFFDDNENPRVEREGHAYMKAYQKGELLLKPEGRGTACFYLEAHEHHGMTYHPATIGWVAESMLQQLGVPYFVDNQTYGASYIYDPSSKHITNSPHQPNIDKYIYGR